MPRQEGHATAGHVTDEHRFARLAERSVDLYLVAVGEELVKTGTPDDPDVRDRSHAGQATFLPGEPEDEADEELADPGFSPPDEDAEDVEDDEDDEDADESDDDEDAEDDDAGAEAEEPFRLSVR
jgi:hypothetical protein